MYSLWMYHLLEVPLMVKVDLVPIDISRSPSKTVQNGSTSTQIPLKINCEEFLSFRLELFWIGDILDWRSVSDLLDERRVEIDILETHCHLPHLTRST